MKRVAIILAGGGATRMGGRDKALVDLGGARLIDHVLRRLAPQVDLIAISGREDYGAGLPVVSDELGGVGGPAAGVFAAAVWIAQEEPDTEGFFTVPVDGPFLPHDLVARLAGAGGPAIAVDEEGAHPTFAYWTLSALQSAQAEIGGRSSVSLRAIAAAACAHEVAWPGALCFFNLNTPDDLATAMRQLED